jgi:hypothetical protein
VGRLSPVAGVYEAHRYAILFCTLLFTLAAAPLLRALGLSPDALEILLAFNLLIALFGVPGRRWRLLLVLAAAAAVGLRAAPARIVGGDVAVASLVAAAGIGFLAVAAAMRFALRRAVVGAEQIFAALSAYLLAGLFFGVLHWAIALAWPESFAEAGASPHGFTLMTAIYYSFVTLATLGYGDVVPRTDVARAFAIFEAVGGQLYIAVTIARLVSARS